jgi:hypothetical protein
VDRVYHVELEILYFMLPSLLNNNQNSFRELSGKVHVSVPSKSRGRSRLCTLRNLPWSEFWLVLKSRSITKKRISSSISYIMSGFFIRYKSGYYPLQRINFRYNGHKTVTKKIKKKKILQTYAEFNCLSRAIFKIQNGDVFHVLHAVKVVLHIIQLKSWKIVKPPFWSRFRRSQGRFVLRKTPA